MQIQQRLHLGSPSWSSAPVPAESPRKMLPLISFHIGALVVDPRRFHRDRTGSGQHLPLSVTRYVPPAADRSRRPDRRSGPLLGDLGLQRRREHLPGTVTHISSSNDAPPDTPPSLDSTRSSTTLSTGVPSRQRWRAIRAMRSGSGPRRPRACSESWFRVRPTSQRVEPLTGKHVHRELASKEYSKGSRMARSRSGVHMTGRSIPASWSQARETSNCEQCSKIGQWPYS